MQGGFELMLVRTERQGLAAELIGGVSKPRHTPKQGFGIIYLVEFLQFLQLEHDATQLYSASPYKERKATLQMRKWCLEKGFIEKREQYKSKFFSKRKPKLLFRITDNGRELLRLLR